MNKWEWFAFGLALTLAIVVGLFVYVGERRYRQAQWERSHKLPIDAEES